MSKTKAKPRKKPATKKAAAKPTTKPGSPSKIQHIDDIRLSPDALQKVRIMLNEEAVLKIRLERVGAEIRLILADEFMKYGLPIETTVVCIECGKPRTNRNVPCSNCPPQEVPQ